MLLNIMLFVGMYPVIFIFYFVLKWNGKNRNGTIFGICVPKEKETAEEFFRQVDQKQAWYQHRMKMTLAVLAAIPLVCFAIPYVSIQFTIWMLWLSAGIVVMQLPTVRVNRELKIWKKERQAKMWSGQQCVPGAEAGKEKESVRQADGVEGKEAVPGAEAAKEKTAAAETIGRAEKSVVPEVFGRNGTAAIPETDGGNKKADAPKSDSVKLIELSEAGQVRKTKPLPFLIPTLISAAAAAAYYVLRESPRSRQMLWAVLLFALCTPMFYVAAGWMDRQRTAVVSYNSEVNINYARAKKQIWNRLWLTCAWINTAFTIFTAFAMRNDDFSVIWLLLGTIGYMAVTLAGLLFAVRKVNRLEGRYEKKIDPLLNEDDDDCWIWGMFYYNKADKRTLLEPRIGYGTTTNMATPIGRGLTIFGAVAILSIPILCIWMIFIEFTPLKLKVQENYLVAEQLKTDYRIAVADITALELVDELPELSKNAGTGMENLYKGNWHIVYAGDCEVFLNPKNHLFLKFTADGELYYMSAADDGKTRELYEELVRCTRP